MLAGCRGLLMTIANNHRTEPLHIWGGKGLERIVRGLTVICGPLSFELVLHELPFKESAYFTTGALGMDNAAGEGTACLAWPIAATCRGPGVSMWRAPGQPVFRCSSGAICRKAESVQHEGRRSFNQRTCSGQSAAVCG